VVIIREVFESSIKLAVEGLKSFGIAKPQIEAIVGEFRTRDRNRMIEQYKSGDMHAGQRHSFGGDDSDDFLLDQA
jgi:glutathione-regulated potassium-efflux system protein KefB